MKKYIFNVTILFLLSCANQGFPPGGPVDRTPPEVISTIPAPNTLHVSLTTPIEITFSEKIDPHSVSNALFISPNPAEPVEARVKGKRLLLKFADSLIPDVTYTITLGTGIKDLRRNGLRESYTLAFSTGGQLDRDQICGRVYYDHPEGVTVWAYFLHDSEDVDPSLQKPQYITQCAPDGGFHFFNLAPRRYRLFAVVDRNRNQTYQVGQEWIGLTSSDVDLRSDSVVVENKLFRLSRVDTSRIRVVQSEQSDRRHIRVRFSQPVFRAGRSGQSIELSDLKGNPVKILDLVINPDDPSIWSLTTIPRDSGIHVLTFHDLLDKNRCSIQTPLKFEFSGMTQPDTSRPRLVQLIPPDSSRDVYLDSAFTFVFSESVDTARLGSFLQLFHDSIRVDDYHVKWPNLSQFSIIPDSSWEGHSWYHCVVQSEKIRDFAGNLLMLKKDRFSWRILDPDTLSEISGTISDEDTSAAGAIFLELWPSGAQKYSYKIVLREEGPYRFVDILPGRYVVQGFRDRDENQLYSYGSVRPFRPAERFFVAPDTILVRSRWPNEGNDYSFKK